MPLIVSDVLLWKMFYSKLKIHLFAFLLAGKILESENHLDNLIAHIDKHMIAHDSHL